MAASGNHGVHHSSTQRAEVTETYTRTQALVCEQFWEGGGFTTTGSDVRNGETKFDLGHRLIFNLVWLSFLLANELTR